MQKLLTITGNTGLVLIGLFVLGIALVFVATSGLTTAADGFLSAAQQGKYDAAYAYASPAFRAATGPDQLKQFLQSSGLVRYKSASWSSREVHLGGLGSLEGTVHPDKGDDIPVTMKFTKVDGEWKLYSIYQPGAGIVYSEENLPLPDQTGSLALVSGTMTLFARCVASKDCTEFRQDASAVLARQFSVADLNKGFKGFMDTHVDFVSLMRDYRPMLTQPPAITDDILELKGDYPTPEAKITFDLKYTYEGTTWKLMGVDIHIGDSK